MADKSARPRGLGRGLSALMADVPAPAGTDATPADAPRPDRSLPIERLHPNPHQPRRSFNQDALAELAASIGEKGIIQPLIVRPSPSQPDSFEIVAGERRWRAAQMAQLHEIPVILRHFDDTEVLEVAIIENIQRADLNPIDEASGYQQLMERFGHTQDQLATALGKSRSHIANLTRLLTLPEEVREMLATGALTAGHARALVGREDAAALARQIAHKGMSVREAEALTRRPKPGPEPTTKAPPAQKDADTRHLESELAGHLGMRVSIDHAPNSERGTVTLHYKSLQQLDDLLRHLSRD